MVALRVPTLALSIQNLMKGELKVDPSRVLHFSTSFLESHEGRIESVVSTFSTRSVVSLESHEGRIESPTTEAVSVSEELRIS